MVEKDKDKRPKIKPSPHLKGQRATGKNESTNSVVGQAIPSVAPELASLFFNKTECFCFVNQTLAPGETKEMVVRYVVGSELPEKITTMTLSYTFFKASEDVATKTIINQKKSIKNNG